MNRDPFEGKDVFFHHHIGQLVVAGDRILPERVDAEICDRAGGPTLYVTLVVANGVPGMENLEVRAVGNRGLTDHDLDPYRTERGFRGLVEGIYQAWSEKNPDRR